MAYSNEQKQAFRQARQLFRHIQNIQRNIDKPSGQIAWAELHFNGNVPKVKNRPHFSDFDLPDNVEELMEAEKKEKMEKLQHNNNIKKMVIVVFVSAFPIFLFVSLYQSEGIETAWMSIFGIPLSYFAFCFLYALVRKDPDKVITQYDENYKKYEDALLAYEYWQNINSVAFWDSLDGHAFERKVADLYRKYGYDAAVSKEGGDGGIDIVLTKGEERIAVQCKAHKKAVAPAVARDLYGTMTSGGFKKGMIVSKNGFTKGVYEFIKDKDITLVDMDGLIKMVNSL
ncbi:restriction endonuclease family protein (plasmid) [Butyrivibrio proteoclasticus B316]|uniref:Restriction endonuclease family protein n=1 Tax=Butyrivibrio proteoclasticus (strain ATCC 51982 / DSM 14932 / B316) TaxID=515622 RepID=E0S4X9_BUTPB|nr:restriction endonuclease [Butyrivibrio proteoclasticus]ADL36461.1 restriction endonuclease family protein [Butyrivibrio proteoclasticus B316]